MNKPVKISWRRVRHDARGVTSVLIALMLTVLLAMAAAAIDIGHALVARNELQTVSDAAALAGARALGLIYERLTPAQQQTYALSGGDRAAVVAAARATAGANMAAGVAVDVDPSDIQIGIWNGAARTFAPSASQPRAVRVVSRLDAGANGAIRTFFGSVIGLPSIRISAVATAAFTAVGATAPGQLDVPFAVSEFYFTQFSCGDRIQFYPNDGTPQSCAAWDTFNQTPPNASTLRSIINGLIGGGYQTPATEPGFSLQFINGNIASVFPNLITLYNAKKDANGYWDVFLPVYQSPSCTPPTGAIPIVGYAEARITNVQGAPNFLVSATIQCNVFEGGTTGGGAPYGPIMSTVPGLVE